MIERCEVLIADDNDRARVGLRALLALRPEIEIVGEAADGEEAIQKVRDGRPDVVLMDARMPQMDGLEATRQIKGHWPQVRIVAALVPAGQQHVGDPPAGLRPLQHRAGAAELGIVLHRHRPEPQLRLQVGL
jgi:two-component system response regulator DegU